MAPADNPIASSGGVTTDREQCHDTPRRAAIATPIPPKLKRLRETVSDLTAQVPSGTVSGSTSLRKGGSSPNGDSSSSHSLDKYIKDKPGMPLISADTGQSTSTAAADFTSRDFPTKTRARKSLADRFDCANSDSRSAPPVALNSASALPPVPIANAAACSTLSIPLLNHISSGTTAGVCATGTDLRGESDVRLRPLASYLDSLRETARAATIRQSLATQTSGIALDARQSRKVCRSSRNDVSPAVPRTVELETTLHRYVRVCYYQRVGNFRAHDLSRCRLMVPPVCMTEHRVTQHLGGPCVRDLRMRCGQGTGGAHSDLRKEASTNNDLGILRFSEILALIR